VYIALIKGDVVMNTDIVTGPLVGAVIGLITNSLAIKMLFRPLKPIYLDRKNQKYRLPFTPGLIPKEKSRLATAVGRIVGTKLLDDDTIKKALLSDAIHDKLTEKIQEFVEGYTSMECTLQEFLETKGWLDSIDGKEVVLKEKVGEYTSKKLVEADIGKIVVDMAVEDISKKLNPMFMSMITKGLNLESLAEKINTIAEQKVPPTVGNYIDREYNNIKNKPVSEVVAYLVNLYPQYSEKVWELYVKVVNEKASDVIREFNIAKIVEDKINEFDVAELEKMTLEIAKKELDALVWLGALLGAIMGIVNALI
jgi:uncharacterized membrane protein YheB (UPF0754 family)